MIRALFLLLTLTSLAFGLTACDAPIDGQPHVLDPAALGLVVQQHTPPASAVPAAVVELERADLDGAETMIEIAALRDTTILAAYIDPPAAAPHLRGAGCDGEAKALTPGSVGRILLTYDPRTVPELVDGRVLVIETVEGTLALPLVLAR